MTADDSKNAETNSEAKKSDEVAEETEVTVDQEESTNTEEANADSETNDLTQTEEFKAALDARVNEVIQARIAREREATRKAREELDRVTEELTGARNEVTTLTEQLDSVANEKKATEFDNLLWLVADQEGVSYDLVSSLRGETLDELVSAVQKVKSQALQKEASVDRIFEGKNYSQTDNSGVQAIIDKYYS